VGTGVSVGVAVALGVAVAVGVDVDVAVAVAVDVDVGGGVFVEVGVAVETVAVGEVVTGVAAESLFTPKLTVHIAPTLPTPATLNVALRMTALCGGDCIHAATTLAGSGYPPAIISPVNPDGAGWPQSWMRFRSFRPSESVWLSWPAVSWSLDFQAAARARLSEAVTGATPSFARSALIRASACVSVASIAAESMSQFTSAWTELPGA
jgi:hypothetical protein